MNEMKKKYEKNNNVSIKIKTRTILTIWTANCTVLVRKLDNEEERDAEDESL